MKPLPTWLVAFFLATGWTPILALPAAKFDAAPPAGAKRLLLFLGSNTLGEQAVPELAMEYLAMKGVKDATKDIRHHELTYVTGHLPGGEKVYIEVHAPGSGDSFKSLAQAYPQHKITHADGSVATLSVDVCDIGMSSRKIKPGEIGMLKQRTGEDFGASGEFAGEGNEHVPALDGLAIIVHNTNPLRRVSFTELKKIYSGEITKWQELEAWRILDPGAKAPSDTILPLRRKEPSGTLDFFVGAIGPDSKAMESIKAYVSSGDLTKEVMGNPAALGFVGQSYAFSTGVKRLEVYDDATGMKPDAAVFPDTAAVKEMRYPLSRGVYLYASAKPKNPEATSFLDFVFSEKAQNIIAERGRLVAVQDSSVEKKPRQTGEKQVRVVPPGTGKVILSLEGSNTIGSECAARLARIYFWQETNYKAKEPGRIVETRVPILSNGKPLITKEGEEAIEIRVACDVDADGSPEVITIRPSGSEDGFTGLDEGTCDLGMSSRLIKPSEVTLLSRFGDMTSPHSQISIGIDALVPIVSPANPVQCLELDEMRRAFLGEIKSWKDLGGDDLPVQIHCRPDRSGTYGFFIKGLLDGRGVDPAAKRHAGNLDVAAAVVEDRGGLGFAPMSQTGNAKVLAVKQGKEGRSYFGNSDSVRLGQYPAALTRHLYLYHPTLPPAEDDETIARWTTAGNFVRLAQSVAGQIAVASCGFVVETPLDRAIADDLAKGRDWADIVYSQYKKPTRSEVSVGTEICTVYFVSGSFDLTSNSVNTINNKLTTFLGRHTALRGLAPNKRPYLVAEGWADASGTEINNELLSLRRAEKVAAFVRRQGIELEPVGAGVSNDPPNNSEANKMQNRRVVIKVAQKPR